MKGQDIERGPVHVRVGSTASACIAGIRRMSGIMGPG